MSENCMVPGFCHHICLEIYERLSETQSRITITNVPDCIIDLICSMRLYICFRF